MNPCVSVSPGSILHIVLPESKFSEDELYTKLEKAVGVPLEKEQKYAVKELLADPRFCDSVSESPGFDN